MSSKVNQFFKNKISSMKGSISDKEKELLENSVPDMSNFTLDLISKTKGSISDKEMEFFKKLLPNK
jgi:gas vesicle protein